MPTLAQQNDPTKEPTSPKPDPADCCVTCGLLLDIERPIWIHTDGRGEHERCS